MIFAEVPVDESEGLILAHSVRTPDRLFRKGCVLGHGDLADLKKAGVERICAVRMEQGDMAEDAASEAVARSLVGNGLEISPPNKGRCNIHACVQGVCTIDQKTIDSLNRADTGVLVSTIQPYEVVGPGRTVATVKVIPYAVDEAAVRALCKDISPLVVHEFRPFRAGLILTDVVGVKESLADKAQAVIASRLETYGSHLQWHVHVAHRHQDVASAIDMMKNQGAELILILGGASASDQADVVPAAIESTTGRLDVFGIPVDPGNLLSSGSISGVPVIGLPGCARSPRLNGVDLILPRLLAGMDVSANTLLGLGVGGLLSDIPDRPQPREDHTLETQNANSSAESIISAIVLAAGTSRRMGDRNKLLEDINGKPMVRQVVETVLETSVNHVTVVTGFEADRVRDAVAGLDVSLIHNAQFMEGLSTSVKAGIRSAPEDADGTLVMLGDMPRVNTAIIDRLIEAFRDSGGTAICAPLFKGQRGNPVLWPRTFFPDILDLTGDTGARRILDRHKDRVVEVVVDQESVLIDVDTPEELSALTSDD